MHSSEQTQDSLIHVLYKLVEMHHHSKYWWENIIQTRTSFLMRSPGSLYFNLPPTTYAWSTVFYFLTCQLIAMTFCWLPLTFGACCLAAATCHYLLLTSGAHFPTAAAPLWPLKHSTQLPLPPAGIGCLPLGCCYFWQPPGASSHSCQPPGSLNHLLPPFRAQQRIIHG